MNKKKLISISAAIITLSSAFAVSAEETLMDKLREANLNDTIIPNNGRVAYRGNTYSADGSIQSAYMYADSDIIVREFEGNVEFIMDDNVYGFNNNEKVPYTYVFLDDSYDIYTLPVTDYTWDPDEILIESYEEDGKVIIHTQGATADCIAEFADVSADLGYNVTDNFAVMSEYVVDGETFEILSGNTMIYPDGIEGFILYDSVRVNDPQPYTVSEELTAMLFSDDTRTVSIIEDPNTDRETTYTTTIGKGCAVYVYTSLAHPYLYTDEACTVHNEGGADLEEDIVLYATDRDSLYENAASADAADENAQKETAIDADLVECEKCGGWYEAGNVFRNHECISYPEE